MTVPVSRAQSAPEPSRAQRETTPEDPRFTAPLRQLIHNISQFGEHWSWRCGIAYSRLDPGYVDGACQYDHTVDSWGQLVHDATEHMARWHDTRVAPPEEAAAPIAHIGYTVDLLAEALRQDPEDTALASLADDRDLLEHLAQTARSSLGVCSSCDGDGSRRLRYDETDVGPEDCPQCDGTGWSDVRAALAARTPPIQAPLDTTPDLGDREELVDVLDTHMRLDDRADAERVVDALIGYPDLLARLAARTPQPPEPRRDDAVAAWLKRYRDQWTPQQGVVWQADPWQVLDDLLDEYRLHADTGTPLDQEAHEGRPGDPT